MHTKSSMGDGRIDNLSETSRILLSTASLVASNLFVAVLAVGTLHLSAQHLGAKGYGQLATVTSFIFFFALLADLGVTTVTARDIAREPHNAALIISKALGFRLLLCVVIAPSLAGAAYFIYPAERNTVGLGVLIMSADLFFVSVQAIVQAYYTARVRNDVPSLLLVITKLLYFSGTVIAVITTHSVVVFITAYVTADAITAATSLYLVRRRVPIRILIVPREWWALVVVSVPLGAMQVVNRIYSRLDSVLLSIMRGPSDVGIYGIAFNFTDALSNLPVYVMGSVLPALVRTSSREELRTKLQVVFDIIVWLAAPIAVGGFELRSQIVLLVAGPGFRASDAPMAIMIFSIVVSFPQVVFVWGCLAVNEYKWLLPAVIVTALVNLATNLLLIPPKGPTGAATAQLITQCLSLLLTGGIFWWKSRIVIRWWVAFRAVIAAAPLLVCANLLGVAWHSGNIVLNPFIGTFLLGGLYLITSLLIGAIPQALFRSFPWLPGGRLLVHANGWTVEALGHLWTGGRIRPPEARQGSHYRPRRPVQPEVPGDETLSPREGDANE